MIPEAVYPEEELRRYNIAPKVDTPVVHDVQEARLADPTAQVVRIQRRKKHKVQDPARSQLIRRHISERSWTLRNWYRHIHWKNFLVVVLTPLAGLVFGALADIDTQRPTLYFALADYCLTVLAINLLYQRFWCHHAFTIKNDQLVTLLTIIASGGGITCARNWCSAHRAHHRNCDVTDRDPHNIRRGFFFSHIGWMVLIFNPHVQEAIRQGQLDKFTNDETVQWQAQNYLSLFVSSGLVVPALICGYFFNDFAGGLLYAGFLKVFCVQNAIFSINSIGHLVGTQPFNSAKSPRNNILVNFFTLGEGNQNFHQEFPIDYRNSSSWYSWDPTKWAIRCLQAFGLVGDLRKASHSTIEKSLIQQQQRLLDNIRSELNWGIPISKLPVFSPSQFQQLADNSKGRYYVVVSGIIHDVTPFALEHPGGLALIEAAHGRDATTAFNGAVYEHSNAARNLLATMRVGALGGAEKIYWKQERAENKDVPLDSDTGGQRIIRSGSQATTSNTVIGGTADAA